MKSEKEIKDLLHSFVILGKPVLSSKDKGIVEALNWVLEDSEDDIDG